MTRHATMWSILIAGFIVILPGATSAATIGSVDTREVITKVGGCTALSVSNINPHMYGEGLDSIDFTIQDASYVALAASIGSQNVSLKYMSRWWTGDPNTKRIHIDTPNSHVFGNIPIIVTFLQGKGVGQPICMATVTFTVDVKAAQTKTPVTIRATQSAQGETKETSSTLSGTVSGAKETPSSSSGTAFTGTSKGSAVTNSMIAATHIGAQWSADAITRVGGTLKDVCDKSGPNIWLAVIVFYLLMTAGVVYWKPAIASRYKGSYEHISWSIVVLLLVLILLILAVWYSSVCGRPVWVPILGLIIAAMGLSINFQENMESPIKTIQLPEAKKN